METTRAGAFTPSPQAEALPLAIARPVAAMAARKNEDQFDSSSTPAMPPRPVSSGDTESGEQTKLSPLELKQIQTTLAQIQERQGRIENLARSLSGDGAIKVQPGTWWAYNFKTNVVTYPAAEMLSRPIEEVFGLILHEVGHRRFTKWTPLDNIPGVGNDPFMVKAFHRLWNALEDPRVNNLMMSSYGGAKKYMRALYETEFLSDVKFDDKMKQAVAKMREKHPELANETDDAIRSKLGQPRAEQFALGAIHRWASECFRGHRIPCPFLKDPEIAKALDNPGVREAIDQAITPWRQIGLRPLSESEVKAQSDALFNIVRDQLWPIYKQLLDQDRKDAKDENLLKDLNDANTDPSNESDKSSSDKADKTEKSDKSKSDKADKSKSDKADNDQGDSGESGGDSSGEGGKAGKKGKPSKGGKAKANGEPQEAEDGEGGDPYKAIEKQLTDKAKKNKKQSGKADKSDKADKADGADGAGDADPSDDDKDSDGKGGKAKTEKKDAADKNKGASGADSAENEDGEDADGAGAAKNDDAGDPSAGEAGADPSQDAAAGDPQDASSDASQDAGDGDGQGQSDSNTKTRSQAKSKSNGSGNGASLTLDDLTTGDLQEELRNSAKQVEELRKHAKSSLRNDYERRRNRQSREIDTLQGHVATAYVKDVMPTWDPLPVRNGQRWNLDLAMQSRYQHKATGVYDDRVTNKRIVPTAHSVEITFVVDCSGSMGGAMDKVKDALVQCMESAVLEKIKVNLVLFADDAIAYPFDLETEDHQTATDLIDKFKSGGTNDVAGLQKAIGTLENSDANRKVVIVITDGNGKGAAMRELLIKASDPKGLDLDIFGIGLGEGMKEVETLYPTGVVAPTPADVAEKLGKIMVDVSTKRRDER